MDGIAIFHSHRCCGILHAVFAMNIPITVLAYMISSNLQKSILGFTQNREDTVGPMKSVVDRRYCFFLAAYIAGMKKS